MTVMPAKVMPSNFISAHVSAVPNHQIGRTTSMEVRGLVAMGGQLGYELDITKMSDDELAEIAQQIDQYKQLRSVIHNGEMYRLQSPFTSNHTAWEYISEDKKTVILLYFKTRAIAGFERSMQCLEALDGDGIYQLRGTEETYNGNVLMHYGICVDKKLSPDGKKMQDFSGRLLIFDKL